MEICFEDLIVESETDVFKILYHKLCRNILESAIWLNKDFFHFPL